MLQIAANAYRPSYSVTRVPLNFAMSTVNGDTVFCVKQSLCIRHAMLRAILCSQAKPMPPLLPNRSAERNHARSDIRQPIATWVNDP